MARQRRRRFPLIEVEVGAEGRQVADGMGKIHNSGILTGGAVKRDNRDFSVFEGRSNQPGKDRLGTYLDEGAHTGAVEVFNQWLKLHGRCQLPAEQLGGL